jgi:hypothetical protein
MKSIYLTSAIFGLVIGGFLFGVQPTMAAPGFVSTSGTSLVLDGRLFVPKGVNLMDHDTLWYKTRTSPTLNWTKASDFMAIKRAGFNSVRLAVKSDYFQETKAPYKFSEKGFLWLDKTIALAKKQNIRIILDMHMPTGGIQQDYQINAENRIFWDDPWMKGRFVDVWREIAKRYRNETIIWAYDLMNEPATTDFASYQRLIQNTVSSIRSNDTNHPIMLQRGMYIKEDGSWDMKFPFVNDPNVILTLHFYQPTDFTLQGAPWIKTNSVLVSYPIASSTKNGIKAWNKDMLASELPALLGSNTSTPVVLTEFGTLFPRQLSGQPVWVRDVAEAAQSLGYGWHYWHYAGPNCTNAFALRLKYSICRPKTLGSLSDLTK